MKQAKTLTERELKAALAHCKTRKHAERDRLAVLLGHWAGLRAKEIAALKRHHVMGEEGRIRDSFLLTAEETKGRKARRVFLNARLQREIGDYLKTVKLREINPYLLQSQKGMAFSANTMCQLLCQIYRECGVKARVATVAGGVLSLNSLPKAWVCGYWQNWLRIPPSLRPNAILT